MIKRMIILIVLGLIFSSCDFIHYGKIAIKENTRRIEMEREDKELRKKDGPSAIVVDEYKEGVEEAIEDILKRPVNKKVQFEGATFIIPENTRLNPKHGNIVDEKTGYGIAIRFTLNPLCISKEINNTEYSFYYSKRNANVTRIAKEIMRINGFKDTCK
ncbi:MAG: hypothetical protein E6Z63_06330 [Fusobacterium periodonticum]|jgi:hypothetical protein|nr:hypothetical protein [Fusobacterium periodonticum]